MKSFLDAIYKKICSSALGNIILGLLWFFNAFGSTGYLFHYHQPQFAVANILFSLFILGFVYTKKPIK